MKQKSQKAEDKSRTRENECYQKNNNKGFDFNCQFPAPSGPVGSDGFRDEDAQRNFEGYEIDDYEDIDRVRLPPKELVSVPRSPVRLPYYTTNGRASYPTSPTEENIPESPLLGPTEDYMDMDGAHDQRCKELKLRVYDKVPDEIPLPPVRKTISYLTVHSHSLPILRAEYQNKVPKPPRRVESKQTVSNTEKVKTVPRFKSAKEQLKRAESVNLVSKAIDSRTNVDTNNELNKALARRKQSLKILNIEENEPKLTNSHSNDNNQQVFYQLFDVIRSDESKRAYSPPRAQVKSPLEEVTDRALKPNPPPAKPKPEIAPKAKLEKSISQQSIPILNDEQKSEPQKIPQKLLNNRMAREKRANSVIKKKPPPAPIKQSSFHKDTFVEKSVIEEKKGLTNLVQDLEKQLGLSQKTIMDSLSTKSHFTKQQNDYQDPPMNLKQVESNK